MVVNEVGGVDVCNAMVVEIIEWLQLHSYRVEFCMGDVQPVVFHIELTVS